MKHFDLFVPSPRLRSSRLLNGLFALASAAPFWRFVAPTATLGAPSLTDPHPVAQRQRRPRAVRSSLRISIVEGMLAEVVGSCGGGATLIAWGLYLRLNPLLLGVLAALPFFAQFVQFPAAWLTSRLGHKRAAVWTLTCARQVLWALVALPFLPLSSVGQQRVLLGVAGVSAMFGVLGNNAWVAWMAELVPPRLRGRYFGRRTALYTIGTSVASLLAGLVVDSGKLHGQMGYALSALALLACTAGAITSLLLLRQHDPAPDSSRIRMDFCSALRPFQEKGSRRVLAFQMVWNAAVGVASTFFTIYMLQNLKMGYAVVALYGTGIALVRVMAVPLWGQAMDRFGVRPVLVACSLGVAAVPVLWLFPTADSLWPWLLLDMVLSGVLWSGHGLATFALPLASAPRQGRPFFLAAFSTAGGFAFALASSLGGWLIQHLPSQTHLFSHQMSAFHWIFLISSALRLLGAAMALRLVEARARPVEELVTWARHGAAARLRAHGERLARPVLARAERRRLRKPAS